MQNFCSILVNCIVLTKLRTIFPQLRSLSSICHHVSGMPSSERTSPSCNSTLLGGLPDFPKVTFTAHGIVQVTIFFRYPKRSLSL